MKRKQGTNRFNRNKPTSQPETALVSSFKRGKPLSDYAKRAREKILNGDV